MFQTSRQRHCLEPLCWEAFCLPRRQKTNLVYFRDPQEINYFDNESWLFVMINPNMMNEYDHYYWKSMLRLALLACQRGALPRTLERYTTWFIAGSCLAWRPVALAVVHCEVRQSAALISVPNVSLGSIKLADAPAAVLNVMLVPTLAEKTLYKARHLCSCSVNQCKCLRRQSRWILKSTLLLKRLWDDFFTFPKIWQKASI